MKKRKLQFAAFLNKNDRPYYVIKDNDNSRMRVQKIKYFKSIEEIVQDKKITKALVIDNYFETEYMKKVKKEVIKYPVSKELEN